MLGTCIAGNAPQPLCRKRGAINQKRDEMYKFKDLPGPFSQEEKEFSVDRRTAQLREKTPRTKDNLLSVNYTVLSSLIWTCSDEEEGVLIFHLLVLGESLSFLEEVLSSGQLCCRTRGNIKPQLLS